MARTRKPAVGDMFYPGSSYKLQSLVDSYLDNQHSEIDAPPLALVAPHAGYKYSGKVAGTAFSHWSKLSSRVNRIVILGPSHHYPLSSMALPSVECFETPLGRVEVDVKAVEHLRELPFVSINDEVHQPEHSIETHLPFLQRVLKDFSIVPILVGNVPESSVALVLDDLLSDGKTLVSISSDLSHFLPYEKAQEVDKETATLIERLESSKITPDRACGAYAVSGFLHFAKEKSLQIETKRLSNSADSAGNKESVVGYGAFSAKKISH